MKFLLEVFALSLVVNTFGAIAGLAIGAAIIKLGQFIGVIDND